MKTITELYNSIPQVNMLIPAVIILILLVFSIVMIFAYRKKSKKYHQNFEYAKKCIDERNEIAKEYNCILHINQGMAQRKEKISKEIIDDLNLRKYIVEKVIELTGKVELIEPMSEYYKKIYAFLTNKI